MLDMKRREFITLLGGAARLAARGARAAAGDAGDRLSPRASAERCRPIVAAFRKGLKEAGYVEGRNVAIEYRWAEGQCDRCRRWRPIWSRAVAVIVADAVAAGACGQGGDLDHSDRLHHRRRSGRSGLVASLNRPGGNVTGVNFVSASSRRSGWRCCTSGSERPRPLRRARESDQSRRRADAKKCRRRRARSGKICLSTPAPTRHRRGFATLFASAGRRACSSAGDPFFIASANRSWRWRRATPFPRSIVSREFVAAGGLISYGTSLWMPIARPASTPGAFSRARSPPTCRSCSRPSSSW